MYIVYVQYVCERLDIRPSIRHCRPDDCSACVSDVLHRDWPLHYMYIYYIRWGAPYTEHMCLIAFRCLLCCVLITQSMQAAGSPGVISTIQFPIVLQYFPLMYIQTTYIYCIVFDALLISKAGFPKRNVSHIVLRMLLIFIF